MADIIDALDDSEEKRRESRIQSVRAQARSIPKGQPGTCTECGEDSKRLVGGLCGYCRDGR